MTALTPGAGVIGSSGRERPFRAAHATTGALAAIAVATTTVRLPPPHWIVALAFVLAAGLLWIAAAIDAVAERIPNRLLLGALALLVSAALVTADLRLVVTLGAGALLGALPLFVVLLVRGIGIGDVKLAGALGATAAVVHPLAALATVFVAALASSAYAAARGIRRLTLGPWLWGGFAVSALLGALR